MTRQIHRAEILHFPNKTRSPETNYCHIQDGIMVVENGLIQYLGHADAFFAIDNNLSIPDGSITQHKGLLIPGMIDAHVHYPQTEIIASYGKQLLDWLETYTFPTEEKYAQLDYAQTQAQLFISQLFAHGTTTASVFATVHPTSVNAFFTAAEHYNARMICGKVLMDRHAPPSLLDTPKSAYFDSKLLIERWHKQGRALYAITPRFAPTSTPEQLSAAGKLAAEFPDTFIQTHLSENHSEIRWVKELFPDQADYLSVYQTYGLVRERALFGHGVHLSTREQRAIASNGAAIAFCPSSNLFLGSGLFPYLKAKQQGINIAIASDVGGGTSLSLLRNGADAYKICQLQGQSLNAFEALYLITQGAAVAMGLDRQIGNLNVGSEADFVVLDFDAIPMLSQRAKRCLTLDERLFSLITLGDERAIHRTYVAGVPVYLAK
jgi:guanine deaminase